MGRKFKGMQTEEQRYAAQQSPAQAQARALREEARAAEDELGRLTAPRRREVPGGRAIPQFGPHSDRDQARVDQLEARARDLWAAVDAAERPKSKWRWL